jgi:hypothetical protein
MRRRLAVVNSNIVTFRYGHRHNSRVTNNGLTLGVFNVSIGNIIPRTSFVARFVSEDDFLLLVVEATHEWLPAILRTQFKPLISILLTKTIAVQSGPTTPFHGATLLSLATCEMIY